ncbi:MAG: rhamnulose-1-phosphate aldolase [Eggerthellaceae bacterium]|nr:rhamnulose-1-phosphate aldolase [Eggerthellaceae bacterium]
MDVRDLLDQGVTRARDAVSSVAVETRPFVRALVRLCDDGWGQGWHERNGGNASYRLTDEDVRSCRACFHEQPRPWQPLDAAVPAMAGEHLLVTAAGSYFRNVADDPSRALGIVEVDGAGASWRPVWGFAGDGRPTSELASHVIIQGARKEATAGASRVVYHCHPVPVIALTFALPADGRTLTRALWKTMTECIMVFPGGVGAVPTAVPGSRRLADLTAEAARDHAAVIWAHHGLLATGATCDEAFGLAHVVVKAAAIYAEVRALCGGEPAFPLSDDDLAELARGLGVTPRADYLGWPAQRPGPAGAASAASSREG